MSDYDVVIIGSGLGGLCCGSILSLKGYRVLVCEAHMWHLSISIFTYSYLKMDFISKKQRYVPLKAVPYIFFVAFVLSITTSSSTFV